MDVKVSVVVCLSEILRITIPNGPYSDDQMKEIFQLIVAALENLSNTPSRLNHKRGSIFEIISKVRIYLLMQDLNCDSLIIDMFKYFLRSLKENYSEDVFLQMGFIIIVVLEEIDEIPLELVFLLWDGVRLDNREISSSAHQLVESVLANCASELTPCMCKITITVKL